MEPNQKPKLGLGQPVRLKYWLQGVGQRGFELKLGIKAYLLNIKEGRAGGLKFNFFGKKNKRKEGNLMEKTEFDQLKTGDIVFFVTPSGKLLEAKVFSKPQGDRVEIVL